MGKEFRPIAFDATRCRSELGEFATLLAAKPDLSERNDIQPFFKAREQISAFIGSYVRTLGPASDLVFEFPFMGDCSADLIVGNKALGIFCVVEFEDGRGESIFKKAQNRSTRWWAPRFEHGFSQIVDWFCMIDDYKKTERFKKDFGAGHVRFSGLLIVGRDAGLSDYERFRLRWRTEKVSVDNHPVECITFDELHRHMDRHLKLISGV